MTAGELAALLRGVRERIVPELEHVVTAVTVDAARRARAYIGQERPEWPPLADITVADKTALGYVGHVSPTDPLLRTGEMRDSIEGQVDGLVGVIGSNDKKALWQEFGAHGTGRNRAGELPPRPFIGLGMQHAAAESEGLMLDAAARAFEGGGE